MKCCCACYLQLERELGETEAKLLWSANPEKMPRHVFIKHVHNNFEHQGTSKMEDNKHVDEVRFLVKLHCDS